MNKEAKKHIEAAAEAIAKGERHYRRAAAEMRAARDAGATWVEIGLGVEHRSSWCKRVVAWAEGSGSAPTPFAEPHRETPDVRGARRVLAEAPVEQVERLVADLPPERRQVVERALVDTHPAHITKPTLGVRDSIRDMERNTSFQFLMAGALANLEAAVQAMRSQWDQYAPNASEEEKEVVTDQIKDAVASLLAMNADPQELLR